MEFEQKEHENAANDADFERLPRRSRAAPRNGHLKLEQVKWNRLIEADATRIIELTRDLAAERRFLELAEEQEKAKARVAHLAATAHQPKDMWFEVETPDHRIVRVKHSSRANLEADLLPGYVCRGVVFGADAEGKGGIDALRGDLMLAFLEGHGFRPAVGAKS